MHDHFDTQRGGRMDHGLDVQFGPVAQAVIDVVSDRRAVGGHRQHEKGERVRPPGHRTWHRFAGLGERAPPDQGSRRLEELLPEGKAHPGSRAGPRTRDTQCSGDCISAALGRFSGRSHARAKQRGAAVALDLPYETLPVGVLTQLCLETDQLLEELCEPARRLASVCAGPARNEPRSGARSAAARSMVTSP